MWDRKKQCNGVDTGQCTLNYQLNLPKPGGDVMRTMVEKYELFGDRNGEVIFYT